MLTLDNPMKIVVPSCLGCFKTKDLTVKKQRNYKQ